jgi:hypothetical protein
LCNTNKINYEKELSKLKETIEIPDIPIAGKWQCLSKDDFEINFIWKIDIDENNKSLIRQKGPTKSKRYNFDGNTFSYDDNTGEFSFTPKNTEFFKKAYGKINRKSKTDVLTFMEITLETTNSNSIITDFKPAIICLPCLN